MRHLIGFVTIVLGASVGGPLWADEATRQYCAEMYPPESYEAEQRAQYIDECLQSYGYDTHDSQQADGPDGDSAQVQDGYYSGTVEDYVESLPEDGEQ